MEVGREQRAGFTGRRHPAGEGGSPTAGCTQQGFVAGRSPRSEVWSVLGQPKTGGECLQGTRLWRGPPPTWKARVRPASSRMEGAGFPRVPVGSNEPGP